VGSFKAFEGEAGLFEKHDPACNYGYGDRDYKDLGDGHE
jgi:hypothetical protein